MKKYFIGLATGVAATVLAFKYKDEIRNSCSLFSCDCCEDEECECCLEQKQKS